MRESSIDEFESLFEQASIPVLNVEHVALARITAVLKGDSLDATVIELADFLAKRFGSEVHVCFRDTLGADAARKTIRGRGLQLAEEPFHSTAELVGQLAIGRSQLVLMPVPEDECNRFVNVDALVGGTKPPVLLIRRAIPSPAAVFDNVLHSLTGRFQQTQNFSYSFTLVNDGGAVFLMHVIDDDDVADVRDALRVSPDLDTTERDSLLTAMARHGERFLKGVLASTRKAPFDVAYRLDVGDVVECVRRELADGDYGLLVVGHHSEGHSYVGAADYQLMHSVHDIPVLAL